MTEKHKGGRGKKSDFRLAVEAMEVGQEQTFIGRSPAGAAPILGQLKKQGKRFSVCSVQGGACVMRLADVVA